MISEVPRPRVTMQGQLHQLISTTQAETPTTDLELAEFNYRRLLSPSASLTLRNTSGWPLQVLVEQTRLMCIHSAMNGVPLVA